jgi:hypothetical protein
MKDIYKYAIGFGAGVGTMGALCVYTIAWSRRQRLQANEAVEVVSDIASERARIIQAFVTQSPQSVIDQVEAEIEAQIRTEKQGDISALSSEGTGQPG